MYVSFIGLRLTKTSLTLINRTRLRTKGQSAGYPHYIKTPFFIKCSVISREKKQIFGQDFFHFPHRVEDLTSTQLSRLCFRIMNVNDLQVSVARFSLHSRFHHLNNTFMISHLLVCLLFLGCFCRTTTMTTMTTMARQT